MALKDSKTVSRRHLLRAATIASGAVAAATALPKRWTRPVVEHVEVPLHAQGSVQTLSFTQPTEGSSPNGPVFTFTVQTTPATPGLPLTVTSSPNLQASGGGNSVSGNADGLGRFTGQFRTVGIPAARAGVLGITSLYNGYFYRLTVTSSASGWSTAQVDFNLQVST